VPKVPDKPGQSPAASAAAPAFEEAIEKLEAILEQMESGDLPLDQLLARFEEGTRLARACQQQLAEAELKIQQLEKTPSGEVKLKPFAPAPSEED
jgi:exodeoxyribonuclease VII small subunit